MSDKFAEMKKAFEEEDADEPKHLFNKAMFFDMGHVHTQQLRLDEIHTLNEKKLRGEPETLGDSTAEDIIREVFKRAVILHKYPELIAPLAATLNDFVGSNPLLWQNPEFGAKNNDQ